MKIIDILVGVYPEKLHVESIEQSQFAVQRGNRPTQYFSSAAAMEEYCKECEREDQAKAKQQAAIDKATGRNKEYLRAIAKNFDNLVPNEEYRVALVTETGDAHCVAWQAYTIKDKYYDVQAYKFNVPAGIKIIGFIVLDAKQIIKAAMPLREFIYSCSIEYTLTLTYKQRN